MKKAKADYTKVSDELRKVQTALDVMNTTVTMEFELPDQDAFRLCLFCRTQVAMFMKRYKAGETEVKPAAEPAPEKKSVRRQL